MKDFFFIYQISVHYTMVYNLKNLDKLSKIDYYELKILNENIDEFHVYYHIKYIYVFALFLMIDQSHKYQIEKLV